MIGAELIHRIIDPECQQRRKKSPDGGRGFVVVKGPWTLLSWRVGGLCARLWGPVNRPLRLV